jgi:hypothetical protein
LPPALFPAVLLVLRSTVWRTTRMPVLWIMLLLGLAGMASGQTPAPPDTLPSPADTLASDSLRPDTVAAPAKAPSGVDTLVNYSADSIDFDVIHRVTVLSGHALITYKDMRLEAERIEVNWDAQVLSATGVRDTVFNDSTRTEIDSVVWIGRPHFIQGPDDFYGDDIAYNMKTKIGRVRGGSTIYEDGRYYGRQFKRVSEDVVTVRSGKFTSCDRDPPHYHFASKELKVMIGKRVIGRPVILYFDDVPVLAVPYGIFPQQRGRTSGILIPTFGESASQGRFLRDIGYYWCISDYMDARTSIDYFEKFGILGRGGYRYTKRYVLNGNLDWDFNTQRQGTTRRRDFSITAAHNHQIDKNTRLAVSGRYVSNQSFNRSVGTVQDQLNQSVQSNATFSRSWDYWPWTMSANVGYTQNLTTNTWSATLPAMSFTHKTGQLFPPPQAPRGVRGAVVPREIEPPWYRAFTYSYNWIYRNELLLPRKFKEEGRRLGLVDLNGRQGGWTSILGNDSVSIFQKEGLIHTAGLSANARILRYLNLNPRLNLKSLWTRRGLEYGPDGKVLDRDNPSGFFQRTTFDLGGSMTTKLYGLAEKPLGIAASFRHIMTPSVGFTYRPDFSKNVWGYYRTVSLADGRSLTYDRFPASENISGAGDTPKGLSEFFSFGIDHLFQMKMGDPDQEKKFDLLSWSMGTGVDLRKDSVRWDDLRMSWRTGVPGHIVGPLQSLSLDVSTTHSLYQIPNRDRINKFFWERENAQWYAPLYLTNSNINVSFTIQPRNIGYFLGIGTARQPAAPDTTAPPDTLMVPFGGASGLNQKRPSPPPPRGMPGPTEASELYQMPFTLSVSLHQSHDYVGHSKTAGMSTRTSLNLSPNWSLDFDYSLDLDRRRVNNASVMVKRDLHCWEATFQWSPLGYMPGYFLRISLKSPQLHDVKIERHRGAGFGSYY